MKSGDNECIMYRLVPKNIPEKKFTFSQRITKELPEHE